MRSPWQRKRDEHDAALDEELRAHLAMAAADRIARGESPDAAVAGARREFGNVAHVKEVTREMWGGAWIERVRQDFRFAVRSLRRSPSFTIAAVLTLALGIGANSAMFTVMNGVLLRQLPFPDPDRVVAVSYQPADGPFIERGALSDRHYAALSGGAAPQMFEHLATYSRQNVVLRGIGEPLKVAAAQATTDFFPVFGVQPALGQVFERDEPVVVLSDRLWRTRFNADSSVVGRVVDIDNVKRTVVAVMPRAFDVPANADLWFPTTITVNPNRTWTRSAVARLRGGVSIEQARAVWTTTASTYEREHDANQSEYRAELIPLKSLIVGDARRPLLIFGGAVVFVLLIACANVANLLLTRFVSRDREMAVRAALGAGRGRLIRQLLTETLTIAALGAALGIVLAFAGVKLLIMIAPYEMLPRVENIHLDGMALLFTAALVLTTALVCGLVPALHATETGLRASLSEGARTMSRGRGRLRAALVGGEIGLALVLLVGAALMLRSFERMRRVDLGFDSSHRLTIHVTLPEERYRTGAEIREFHTRMVDRLARLPGVNDAAVVNWLPFSHMMIVGGFTVEGGAGLDLMLDKMVVTPRYFSAIGQHLLRGRPFTDDDRAGRLPVAIVSQSVADRVAPNGDAVGKRIALNDKPTAADWLTIVGVVSDVVQNDVTRRPDAAIYQPMAQVDFRFFLFDANYVVRTSEQQAGIAAAMMKAMRDADPTLPVEPVRELSDLVRNSMLTPRFQSRVLATFSLLALLLSSIGIYGVMAYGVSQRQQEIGVRMALGATPGDVLRMVLRRAAVLALPGLGLGVAASLGLTRLLSRFLFHVTPTDPVSFAGMVLLLAGVALVASYLPARRASRLDPLVALRRD